MERGGEFNADPHMPFYRRIWRELGAMTTRIENLETSRDRLELYFVGGIGDDGRLRLGLLAWVKLAAVGGGIFSAIIVGVAVIALVHWLGITH